MNNPATIPSIFSHVTHPDSCTTILVGSQATTDGSRIIARTEDHDPCLSKVLLVHPARKNAGNTFRANENRFTYPIPKTAFGYTSFSNGLPGKSADEMTWGAAGFNDKGVGMTATETIFASDAALKNDPYLPDTGITEDSITDVILPYITSAKEGAAKLGKIIDEKGAGEGFGVAFVDEKEIWYLETGSGHQWLATRIPDDSYFVTGNQGRLRQYRPNDTSHFMASKTLVKYAVDNGLYNPKVDGEFDFEKAYTLHDDAKDRYYNYPRVYALQHLYTKGIKTRLEKPDGFNVFEKPSAKMDIDAVKAGLRNTYENLGRMPYTAMPDYTLRPISLFRTQQSHILQSRNGLPVQIANVEYVSYGMPSISIYIPFYPGCLTDFPDGYKKVTDGSADSESAQWKFRKLQTLVMVDYHKYAPIVQKGYRDAEMQFARMQKKLEKAFIAESDSSKALGLVNAFENKVFTQALEVTEKLTNQLFTLLANDLNQRYKFAGA
ncbi:C69 family dipeptidase [Leminorella grimontii]|uniref:C69 family dipeptidase n=1 Tax=Leminorella grimontii TaxID=82981 RepID=UPI00321FBBE0